MSQELLERAAGLFGDAVLDRHNEFGDATLLIERARVLEVMRRLRDELGMNMLMDLTAVDYLGREPRFEVVYHLASVETQPRGTEPAALGGRLRIKAGVPEDPPEIDSISSLYPAANWMEREAFDLYGVRFMGHPELRRILLYEEFEGYPLRKDYPKERRQPLVGPRN